MGDRQNLQEFPVAVEKVPVAKQPSELLRLKFENNLLQSQLIVKKYQDDLNAEIEKLRVARVALLNDMRVDAGAGPTDIYNAIDGVFVPRKE